MDQTAGSLSVSSENIFPILKQWLYAERDIYFRELVSNCADAITKRRTLSPDGAPSGRIDVVVNMADNTVRFRDNGVGMTAAEVEQYICRIAFSGATEFLQRHRDAGENIIGHFGLGFYSAFMDAERVTIDSLSCRPGAEAVHWDCGADMAYTLSPGSRREAGTEVTLYLPACPEEQRVRAALRRFFGFFPTALWLTYGGGAPQRINDGEPLWSRRPEDCASEDYVNLYHQLYADVNDPLFWLHLYDEELGVKGILYFRQNGGDGGDGRWPLYSNGVFVAENVRELVPNYLLLQNGVLDCGALPLLVSRAQLQEDVRVQAIREWLVQQLVQKLYGMFAVERETYERFWPWLDPFVKYACMSDRYVSSYLSQCILFQDLSGGYVTLKAHLNAIAERHPGQVFYVSDPVKQAWYVRLFRRAGLDALLLTHVIDTPLIQKLEQSRKGLHFCRVDSDLSEVFGQAGAAPEDAALSALLARVVTQADTEVKLCALDTAEISLLLTMSEAGQRLRDMVELYGVTDARYDAVAATRRTLLVNVNSPLVRRLAADPEGPRAELLARQLYDLARLGQETLEAEDMAAFIERSTELLGD